MWSVFQRYFPNTTGFLSLILPPWNCMDGRRRGQEILSSVCLFVQCACSWWVVIGHRSLLHVQALVWNLGLQNSSFQPEANIMAKTSPGGRCLWRHQVAHACLWCLNVSCYQVTAACNVAKGLMPVTLNGRQLPLTSVGDNCNTQQLKHNVAIAFMPLKKTLGERYVLDGWDVNRRQLPTTSPAGITTRKKTY